MAFIVCYKQHIKLLPEMWSLVERGIVLMRRVAYVALSIQATELVNVRNCFTDTVMCLT